MKDKLVAADCIRAVAKQIGYWHRNDVIIEAVHNRYRLKVGQVQVIQAIGCWKNRRVLPTSILKLAHMFLAACNNDERLVIGVIKNAAS